MNTSTIWTHYSSPLGAMVLAAHDSGLCGAWFEEQAHFDGVGDDWQRCDDDAILCDTAAQFDEWFGGRRSAFSLPLAPQGSAFQQAVWQCIAAIPYGASNSYGAIARDLGKPSAARAVGAATGRNPLSIIVPCHRVLASDGGLVNYAGGLPRKRALLELESRTGATA